MHERTVVPQSNLIQACEWILWGWEPVIKAEEPYCGQRKRPANCEENLDYHRAGNTLFDAFRQRFLKLYEKDDDEGKYYQELYKNKKGEEKGKETIEDILADENLHFSTDTDYFNLLLYITKHWLGKELFFKTEELKREFPVPDHFERYSTEKYKLELTNDFIIVLHKPDGSTLPLKRLNVGHAKDLIKYLFEHPNQDNSSDDILNSFERKEGQIRLDQILFRLRNEMKEVVKNQDISQQIKDHEMSIITHSFIYEKRQIKLITESN